MSPPHATTHVHIATLLSAGGIAEQHQADVLGEQVDRVVPRDGDGDLELAGQVGGAVQGLGGIATEDGSGFLELARLLHGTPGLDAVAQIPVHPEVQVGALGGLGRQQVGDAIRQQAGLRVAIPLEGSGRGHHIAVDVATGRERRAQGAHDAADHLLEVRLLHAVHLEGLARGDPQRAVAEPIGEGIERQIEGRGNAPARIAQPQHHLPILLNPLATVVPIVLLVAAVELEDLDGGIGEAGQRVAQFGSQGIMQVAAAGLERLLFGGGVGGGSRWERRAVGDRRRGHRHAEGLIDRN